MLKRTFKGFFIIYTFLPKTHFYRICIVNLGKMWGKPIASLKKYCRFKIERARQVL